MFAWLMNRAFHPWHWTVASAIVLAADFATGPHIQFPILFLIPVSMAARAGRIRWGVVLAIALPAIHALLRLRWAGPSSVLDLAINFVIRAVVLLFVVKLLEQAAQKEELQKQVHVLQGLLPICCFCKRIRNDKSIWEPIELYVAQNSAAQLTHGICEDCAKKHYGFVSPKE